MTPADFQTSGKRTWRTLASGAVEVNGAVLTLSARERKAFEGQVWAKWRALAEKHAARAAVPLHWLLGTIYAESGGNPLALSTAGAWGLMQLMPFNWKGIPKEQVADPDTNIRLGSDIQASHIRRFGRDLPRVAAAYNSGGNYPSTNSPWGLRENKNYITNVVAASNYALERAASSSPAPPPAAPPALPADDFTNIGAAALLLKIAHWLSTKR
jgi:soluble lytic murein transglycosylase-like protein